MTAFEISTIAALVLAVPASIALVGKKYLIGALFGIFSIIPLGPVVSELVLHVPSQYPTIWVDLGCLALAASVTPAFACEVVSAFMAKRLFATAGLLFFAWTISICLFIVWWSSV